MFIVEGNIGVGKSTFLALVKKHSTTIDIVPEPVGNWTQQTYGSSLLAKFYENPKRWTYTMETLAMAARARDYIQQRQKNPQRLLERSLYSGHYCFARNGYAQGNFTELEWELYQKWVHFLLKESCPPPHGFIYLRAEPAVCFERIRRRSRQGEDGISFEYIQQIHHWHERFLIDKDGLFDQLSSVPTLVLDCSKDFVENHHIFEQHLGKIESFMEQSKPRKNFDFSPLFI